MARYYFDTLDDDTAMTDELGLECADLDVVKRQAALYLAELARDVIPGVLRRRLVVKVHDGHQPVLESKLTFEAIILKP